MTYFAPNINKNNHCFFGRKGGVSKGKYQSLNVNINSQDDKEDVQKNYQIIARYYHQTPERILRLNQGITGKAVFVTEPSFKKITADGAVTNQKSLILSISTADCAPVLFYDEIAGLIGAAHAGWRGAYNGIVENTVALMEEYGSRAENLKAAIGPCIQQNSFEMGAEVYADFIKQTPQNAQYFKPSPQTGHYLFDLEGYVKDKLQKLGIKNISASHIDTFANEEEYFSYRRETKRGNINIPKDFGTELSTIMR